MLEKLNIKTKIFNPKIMKRKMLLNPKRKLKIKLKMSIKILKKKRKWRKLMKKIKRKKGKM
jgi:hypothetical protein